MQHMQIFTNQVQGFWSHYELVTIAMGPALYTSTTVTTRIDFSVATAGAVATMQAA